MMTTKENEINECRRILHQAVVRIKNVFENNPEEFSYTFNKSLKNFIEGKSLEDKFNFYFEKLLKYLDVYFYLTF